MRKVINLNEGWLFIKGGESEAQRVNVPHTWNNFDGQDGGNDYFRGECRYAKNISLKKYEGEKLFLEFKGVCLEAKVLVNGKEAGSHQGGFSTFRIEITDFADFENENEIVVIVDNSANPGIYPQVADFTFFGGIYRDVNLITVEESHFDLMDGYSDGIYITPKAALDGSGEISVLARTVNAEECSIFYTLTSQDGKMIFYETAPAGEMFTRRVDGVTLWDGVNNPYLYTVSASLVKDGETIDTVEARTGFRFYSVNNEKGFFLNGRHVALHGVSRHQDREDLGWAVTKAHQRRDMELIKEVGANAVRLAHYQHDDYFYDLCDEAGMVTWTEIPLISMMSDDKAARINAASQLLELIKQNYNHPSICFWGIQSSITMGGESDELTRTVRSLCKLAKKLDPTRLTTQANISSSPAASPLNSFTDVLGYNHFFGWYQGETDDLSTWLDVFHLEHPEIKLCISEYGADGNVNFHSENPQPQDYSEEYQALYHEAMLKAFRHRPYIWGTFVWNMFDFASDIRDEGGVKGRNNKGLVTYDRKIKKDAFYLYKAFWSKEEFIHITSRRYVDRPYRSLFDKTTTIKVYSNLPELTLTINGREVRTLAAKKIFVFNDVKLKKGLNTVSVTNGTTSDEIEINSISPKNANASYRLNSKGSGTALNVADLFDSITFSGPVPEMKFPKGYYSIKDKLDVLMASPQVMAQAEKFVPAELINHPMINMIKGISLEKISDLAWGSLPDGLLERINAELIKIKKE